MFFLKQNTILLLIVAFTQAFSQEMNSDRFYANDQENTQYSISSNDNQLVNEREGSMQMKSDHFENDLLVMVSDIPNQENEDSAVEPIQFLAPSAEAVFKKGWMVEVRWTGGNPDDEFALDLFDGRFHYRHLGEVKNSGTYPWVIPKDVEPGKEYKFKLTNTEDFGEFTFSQSFIIKRKVPIAAWLIPGALVVGGGIYLLLSIENNELPDLPTPIDPN